MRYITRTFHSLAVLLSVFCITAIAQISALRPNETQTFQLRPDEAKLFSLQMKQDDFAELAWLANDSLLLDYAIADDSDKILQIGDSTEGDAALFVAPRDGLYSFLLRFNPDSELKSLQTISLEYKNRFQLPQRTRQKAIRIINGYSVKILSTPSIADGGGDSVVVFEKATKLKKVLRAGGGADYIGFSFPDVPYNAKKLGKAELLVKNTIDKTGDGIPDVMIDYFSGGAHCCWSTYFINLGTTVEVVDIVQTAHAGLTAAGANPKGGLRFATNENAFAYWNISFAGSPLPPVTLEYDSGNIAPNFDLMKKPPPSLTMLRTKARASRLKISNDPYTEVSMDFEEAFWSVMLDLIYTGNEALAWQYFDLAWPAEKPGKERFMRDFKEQLGNSYYGTKKINADSGFGNFMRLMEKLLKSP